VPLFAPKPNFPHSYSSRTTVWPVLKTLLDPILRLQNLQLQRQRHSRLELARQSDPVSLKSSSVTGCAATLLMPVWNGSTRNAVKKSMGRGHLVLTEIFCLVRKLICDGLLLGLHKKQHLSVSPISEGRLERKYRAVNVTESQFRCARPY
jgi:hypothetical protein